MLETILEKINTNLQEISNTLKERNELLRKMTKTTTGENKNMKETTIPEPVMIPVQPTITEPIPPTPEATTRNAMGNLNIQPSIPVNNQVAINSQPTVIPTVAQSFTREQIAVAMGNATAVGKRDVVINILKSFNVQTLMEIKPEDYNKVATMLMEAGVKV